MAPLLIVNADDLGLSKAVNYGIIEAHRNGIVTSTTAMMNMPNIEHAAELVAEYPTLAIGLHFVLTAGKPFSSMPSLVREGVLGKWLWDIEKAGELPLDEIMAELACQYAQFVTLFGRRPSHIDSHHHVHMFPDLYPLVAEFAREKSIALRAGHGLISENAEVQLPRGTDYFSMRFYDDSYGDSDGVSDELFLSILDEVEKREYHTIEVMCHPAFIDNDLLASQYAYQRLDELEVLTSKSLKAAILARGYQLGSYLDLA
ncbi:MAG: chitin disaccharide deacetylase [Enterobacteriaceae bacterium]|jgi:predicted glycoside hydrolase/deacetylase ChbG (UPF0249 family)|nr:chitin disaccharide deacetylase [Enterobacteriaceae bacterium]